MPQALALMQSSFMPHGMCYLWEPELLWLHVLSDILIGGAYFAIPPTLLVLVVRARREVPEGAEYTVRGLPHEWMFLAFGLFIVACGTTHFMAVWNVWNADYWVSGGVKVVTAVASLATAIALPPLIPRALELVRGAREADVSRKELEQANEELRAIRDSLQRELDSATDDIHGLALEVTTRREAMEHALREAQEARDEARAASKAKSDFMAVISHELRTPLNGIIGYSDLLTAGVKGELNPDQQLHVDRIKLGADHLLRIIDDILVYVRSDTSPTALSTDPVQLTSFVAEVVAMLRPEADGKGVALEEDVQDVVVTSDRERLLRIVTNLVSNAVKFTEDGTVRLEAGLTGGRLRVAVSDTGPGIAEQYRERIFDAFWQIDQSATRRVGGTGLGLSIARRLARQLGGDVVVEESSGAGSTLVMEVPVQ